MLGVLDRLTHYGTCRIGSHRQHQAIETGLGHTEHDRGPTGAALVFEGEDPAEEAEAPTRGEVGVGEQDVAAGECGQHLIREDRDQRLPGLHVQLCGVAVALDVVRG